MNLKVLLFGIILSTTFFIYSSPIVPLEGRPQPAVVQGPCGTEPCSGGGFPWDYVRLMSGGNEIPPVNSNGSGEVLFGVTESMSDVSYLVNVTGIENITKIQMHEGRIGENGPVVVTLYDKQDPIWKEYPLMQNGSQIIKGLFNSSELTGPYQGIKIEDFSQELGTGNLYVNIMTGKFTNGELRGQIEEAEM